MGGERRFTTHLKNFAHLLTYPINKMNLEAHKGVIKIFMLSIIVIIIGGIKNLKYYYAYDKYEQAIFLKYHSYIHTPIQRLLI
jgi:hypothetical protein